MFQPKLSFDDLYGYWYRVLVGLRELPREVSNASVGGMRAELSMFEVSSKALVEPAVLVVPAVPVVRVVPRRLYPLYLFCLLYLPSSSFFILIQNQ